MAIPLDYVRRSLESIRASAPEHVENLFAELRTTFDTQATEVKSAEEWKQLRDIWLGRKSGVLSAVTDNWLKPAAPELKRAVGAALNQLRGHVENVIEERRSAIEASADRVAAAREHVDLSLPGIERVIGTRHLVRQTMDEFERIFLSLGYSVASGPEIETPYYNFEALNIPETHPARDTMDTFYLDLPPGAMTQYLLRTHTSPVQVHTMESQPPPVRVIVPGKVYRRDNPDATHGYMFHQVEGLAVDEDITFCEFKGTVEYFIREFFGPKVKTRLRPSYFPFTEPSAEVDASCIFCDGAGCRICKFSGWIEMFGAGMVDPAVYGFVNYDAKKVCGFAFGLGVDRFAMLKYGITDVQLLFQNDVRFLRQFP